MKVLVEDVDDTHAFADKTTRKEGDIQLRAAGFVIHSRREGRQAEWRDVKSGKVLNESAALTIMKLRMEHK